MNKSKFILGMIVLLFPLFVLAEIQLSRELALNASRTYGYTVGQDYTLDHISKKYPTLSNDVFLAKNEFKLSFGSSLKKIDTFMQKNLATRWYDVKNEMQRKIIKTRQNQNFTKKQALQFINEVKNRAKGKIESPVIETLLIFRSGYNEYPERELTDGYKYIYKNDGSRKAKGIKFSMSLPKTWKAKEGNRPNVVQKFIGQSGATIMVLIKDMPLAPNETVKESDVTEMLSRANVKQLMPANSTYINSGKLTLEGLPGYWLKYKTKMSRVRMTIEMETIVYGIFYKNKFIQIQGSNVVSVNDETIPDGGIKKYEKLFDMVVNSFVIDSLY